MHQWFCNAFFQKNKWNYKVHLGFVPFLPGPNIKQQNEHNGIILILKQKWRHFQIKFLLTWRRYSGHFWFNRWEFDKKVLFVICWKVSFRTQYLKSVLPNMLPCVLPNMKLELRSRGSRFTPPTNPYPKVVRANIMGPKASNMRVF